MTVSSAKRAGVEGYNPANCHAVVIGINKYTKHKDYQKWNNLHCAAKDATDVAEVLRNYYGFGSVTLLLNEEATRSDILDALDAALDLTDRDSLLIYYAGHGWMDRRNNGYWIPSDARLDKKGDYISINRIVGDYLRKYQVRHLLVVSDSCFSGAMLRGGGESRPNGWELPRSFRKSSRWVLTSGDLEPVADGAGLHSPFAERFLQFLKVPDSDAFGVLDLYMFMRKQLDSESICQPLKCASHMPGGEFVFCRLNKPEGALSGSSILGVTQPIIGCIPSAVPLFGKLILKSTCDGLVSIDGGAKYAISHSSGLVWSKIAVGTHVIRVTSGKKVWEENVEIMDGVEREIGVEFAVEPEVPDGGATPFEYVQQESLNISIAGGISAVGIGTSHSLGIAIDKARTRCREELANIVALSISSLKNDFMEESPSVENADADVFFDAANDYLVKQITRFKVPRLTKYSTKDNTTTVWTVMAVGPKEIVDAIEIQKPQFRMIYLHFRASATYTRLIESANEFEEFLRKK